MNLTNATKGQIIVAVNALLGLAVAFDVGFTEEQQGAIILCVNALAGLYVGLTYKDSPKRVAEGGE